MAVLMEVPRVGVEAEAEMMIADTHVATEKVQTMAAEMEIIIEVVAEAALAHGLEVQIDTIAPEGIAAIAMRQKIASQGKNIETGKNEPQNERAHLH